MRIPLVGWVAVAGLLFAAVPFLGLPAFYESFLYLVFSAIIMATSWNILSGYSGYFSFGHGAFFGPRMHTTATLAGRLELPFLLPLPAACLFAAPPGLGAGASGFRPPPPTRVFFPPLTPALTFPRPPLLPNPPRRRGGGPPRGGYAVARAQAGERRRITL